MLQSPLIMSVVSLRKPLLAGPIATDALSRRQYTGAGQACQATRVQIIQYQTIYRIGSG